MTKTKSQKYSESPDTVKVTKVIYGKVVSMKSDQTAVVEVTHAYRHPVYKKALKRTRKFTVHNQLSDLVIGDVVGIKETRPVSKTKHFMIFQKVGGKQ